MGDAGNRSALDTRRDNYGADSGAAQAMSTAAPTRLVNVELANSVKICLGVDARPRLAGPRMCSVHTDARES
jgi:hypothetical protein